MELRRPAAGRRAPLVVDPVALFELSPYLYMQFMESLGATDGSVEPRGTTRPIDAAWEFPAASVSAELKIASTP